MGSYKKSMLLTAEKTCCLIRGLTIASFFLGLILGYNNISIFSSETVQEETATCSFVPYAVAEKDCPENYFCKMDWNSWSGKCSHCVDYDGCSHLSRDDYTECRYSCYGISPPSSGSGSSSCSRSGSSPGRMSSCTDGSSECSHCWFCNMDYGGNSGFCERCSSISNCQTEPFIYSAGNEECSRICDK